MGNHVAAGTVPALMTKEQAAEYLGVAAVTVERLTSRGKLPVTRMPGTGAAGRPRNMYSRAALDGFIERHTCYLGEDHGTPAKPTGKRRSVRKSATQALREAEGRK